jgi:hypothetical protein
VINIREIRVWKFYKAYEISILKRFLFISLFSGMLWILFVFSLFFSIDEKEVVQSIDIVVLISMGMIFGLGIGFIKYFSETKSLTSIAKPYRPFALDFRNETMPFMFLTFFFSLFTCIYLGEFGLLISLQLSLIFTAMVWIASYFSLFQHLLLAFFFKRESKAPFQMAKFYDYCASLRLLEKDGGTWRFRHQIIHDYFIEQAEIENFKKNSEERSNKK